MKQKIDKTAQIAPSAHIGENVVIGENVKIMHCAYIENCKIGAGTVIYPFASIGSAPQDLGYKGELTKTIIGENCQIREFVTVNRASGEGNVTKVGNKCLLMAYAHVAHNCTLEDEVIMANAATLGGHVKVGYGAFIGGLSVFHQNIRIGDMAIISGASAARMDILPYTKSEGVPCIPIGLNAIGLKRRGVGIKDREAINQALKLLKSEHLNTTQAIEEIEKTVYMNDYVKKIIDFVKTSKRGVTLRDKGFRQASEDENG